jgi:hypothetical protein
MMGWMYVCLKRSTPRGYLIYGNYKSEGVLALSLRTIILVKKVHISFYSLSSPGFLLYIFMENP